MHAVALQFRLLIPRHPSCSSSPTYSLSLLNRSTLQQHFPLWRKFEVNISIASKLVNGPAIISRIGRKPSGPRKAFTIYLLNTFAVHFRGYDRGDFPSHFLIPLAVFAEEAMFFWGRSPFYLVKRKTYVASFSSCQHLSTHQTQPVPTALHCVAKIAKQCPVRKFLWPLLFLMLH